MAEDHNPFKELKKISKARKAAKEAESGPDQPAREDGFTRAMRDVFPIDDPKGRQRKQEEPSPAGLHRPFENLTADDARSPRKKAKAEPRAKKPPKPACPEPERQNPPEPGQDERRFLAAVQGVKPLNGKGRQIQPERPEIPEKPAGNGDDAEVMEQLSRLVGGEIEFSLEFTDEYMHGKVKGLDSAVFQKLKNGRFSYQAHIDLHGLNADQAGFALIGFIREQYMKGVRCVLVVHGRGMNSPAGMSILKHEVQRWLTRDPLRRVVLAFVTAMPRHGGAGAIYVLLRKYKKTKGKVMWDRLPPNGDFTG